MLFTFNLRRLLRPRSFDRSSRVGTGSVAGSVAWPAGHNRLSSRRRRIGPTQSRLGAATIEMALVAPFIFFIVFGSVEFARMMMVKQALTNAAREGCRHATLVTCQDHDSAEDVVRSLLDGTIGGSQDSEIVKVTITPSFHSSPESGTEVLTLVEVDCADVSWLPATLFAGAKVRGVAFMNRE